MTKCDICGGSGPHGLVQCRTNLLARVRTAQRKAGTIPPRVSNLKDQTGVALSEEFMRIKGLGRYSVRETGRTISTRVTDPISMDRYVVVVSGARCLACDAGIRPVSLPAGGKYWVCAADSFKGCGWYISWTAETDRGRQVRIIAKAA